ncbi:MAG TPA: lytic transglycosylase domain-containing protein [Candidatus Saccharimonadia bacterium]|jgi:membrane-bound lytic murein transglycosylase B
MTVNLKTTILYSSLLAVTLNVAQFFSGFVQHSNAFAPSWAYASSATPVPTAAPPALPLLQPADPATVTTASVTSPTEQPADTAAVAARLSAAGLKPDYAALYLGVQRATGTPWQLLAAVHKVETGQSGSTSRTSSAGAEGPMQFMPGTFNHYAVDGDGNGTKDITNVTDAVYTAGRYLAAGGATRGQYSSALYNYNHSWSYVSTVTGIYSRLGL